VQGLYIATPFPILHRNVIKKFHLFCAIFPDAATNIQKSTGKEGEINPTWEYDFAIAAALLQELNK
jgi:hypothetical protein